MDAVRNSQIATTWFPSTAACCPCPCCRTARGARPIAPVEWTWSTGTHASMVMQIRCDLSAPVAGDVRGLADDALAGDRRIFPATGPRVGDAQSRHATEPSVDRVPSGAAGTDTA